MRRLFVRTLLFAPVLLLIGSPAADTETTDSPTEWLAEYIAIDTSNPPGNETPAVAFLRAILHREGIETSVFVSPRGRPSLYARLDAEPDADQGAVVLTHHMDVVPAGPGWTVEPFSQPPEDDRIWGRGAVDDKSLGIAHLAAFIDLARSKLKLKHSVVFLAVADEETGGKEGTGWLIERHPELFEDTVAVLGEGGLNRAYGGRVLWWGIEVSQKRPLWLRVTAWGRGGHGSMLNLGSAPHQLAKAVARLVDRPLEYRVTPPVSHYLESVALYQSDAFAAMVDSLDDIITRPEPHRDLLPGIPNYLLDTVQVNVLEAGEQINVVPTSASALIDARLLPGTDQEDFLARIEETLGADLDIEVLLDAPPAPVASIENSIYQCLSRSLPGNAPTVPSFIPGITDSRYFRQQKIDAYGFSPFVFEPTEAIGVHGKNEKISIATFERGVETMRRVLKACVAY
ncbi:MAG: M20/M25/M40 family metallo-hydrolase [Deltaproteobacteria bacterium]|nr:M20/M25/M40 family metallo-hydrolase [Deltaproteobacteria bacterium]